MNFWTNRSIVRQRVQNSRFALKESLHLGTQKQLNARARVAPQTRSTLKTNTDSPVAKPNRLVTLAKQYRKTARRRNGSATRALPILSQTGKTTAKFPAKHNLTALAANAWMQTPRLLQGLAATVPIIRTGNCTMLLHHVLHHAFKCTSFKSPPLTPLHLHVIL